MHVYSPPSPLLNPGRPHLPLKSCFQGSLPLPTPILTRNLLLLVMLVQTDNMLLNRMFYKLILAVSCGYETYQLCVLKPLSACRHRLLFHAVRGAGFDYV